MRADVQHYYDRVEVLVRGDFGLLKPEALREAVGRIRAHPGAFVVVDMKSVGTHDVTSIALLLFLRDVARKGGGDLSVRHLPDVLGRIMDGAVARDALKLDRAEDVARHV